MANHLTDRTRRIVRVDGTVQVLEKPLSMREITKLLAADGLDTVNLRHMGAPLMVMLVDDLSHPHGKPVNQLATELYHANCIPGATHQIRGDVAIVPDFDFE